MKWRFYLLTWLYSVLFNIAFAAIMLFGQVILRTHYLPMAYDLRGALEDLYMVGMFSVPLSVPGLLALLLATYLSDFFMNPRQRFLFVTIFCMAGTQVGYILLWAVTGINPFADLVWFIPLSIAAVLIALLIKRKHFYKAFIPFN